MGTPTVSPPLNENGMHDRQMLLVNLGTKEIFAPNIEDANYKIPQKKEITLRTLVQPGFSFDDLSLCMPGIDSASDHAIEMFCGGDTRSGPALFGSPPHELPGPSVPGKKGPIRFGVRPTFVSAPPSMPNPPPKALPHVSNVEESQMISFVSKFEQSVKNSPRVTKKTILTDSDADVYSRRAQRNAKEVNEEDVNSTILPA